MVYFFGVAKGFKFNHRVRAKIEQASGIMDGEVEFFIIYTDHNGTTFAVSKSRQSFHCLFSK